MLPSHLRAIADIRACRTSALGGHLVVCDACGEHHHRWHSCRNRSCPRCGGAATERWLAARQQLVLPVEHFHLVFTLPSALRAAVRKHQRALLGALFRSATTALRELAADPRYAGGAIGVLAAVHTWGRNLAWHPHMHCLVPGCAVDDDGKVHRVRKGFLVPVRALGALFRGKFMAEAKRLVPDPAELPAKVWDQPWVVFIKKAVRPEHVLSYLGRYVHRTAISDQRILTVDEQHVTFRYRDHRDGKQKTMRVHGLEFMRRFLQHVPPKGLHRIRYYGLFHHSQQADLERARLQLSILNPDEPPANTASPTAPSYEPRCPYCGSTDLLFLDDVPPQSRAPPLPAPRRPRGNP